jgi:hypothetical protein
MLITFLGLEIFGSFITLYFLFRLLTLLLFCTRLHSGLNIPLTDSYKFERIQTEFAAFYYNRHLSGKSNNKYNNIFG